MRKTLLSGLCFLFTGLSFTQTPHVLHLNNLSEVKQYDLQYVGSDRLHAGIALNGQQQAVVWYAKINEANALLWVKSFPLAINNPGTTGFMDLNHIVDVESCNQSDDFMLSVKRIDVSTFQTFIEVLKITAEGELVWGRRIAFTEDENTFGVIQSNRLMVLPNDAVIVSNGTKTGITVCKLSAQGARMLSKRISITETPTEEQGNGGWAFTTAEDGGFYASFQKEKHPVMMKLDSQLNTEWADEWNNREMAITGIRDLVNGQTYLGGFDSNGDFVGVAYPNYLGTFFYPIPQNGHSGFTDFDFFTPTELPGRIFAASNEGYTLIDLGDATFTVHHVSNGSNNYGTHYQLRGNHFPIRNATYFTRDSDASTASYIENLDLEQPQCLQHDVNLYPFVRTSIPDSAVLHPELFTQDAGSFTIYSPTTETISGSMSETCFYLGTEEIVSEELIVYPNPAIAGKTMHLTGIAGMENGTITLTDLQGKVVAQHPFSEEISLPELYAGIYFVTISEPTGKRASTKIMIH